MWTKISKKPCSKTFAVENAPDFEIHQVSLLSYHRSKTLWLIFNNKLAILCSQQYYSAQNIYSLYSTYFFIKFDRSYFIKKSLSSYSYSYILICHFSLTNFSFCTHSEAASGGVLLEKVLLEISQNSLENTCSRVSFASLQLY